MPDAATKPQAETPAPDAPVKRAKSPNAYHVLQLVDGAWKHMTERAAVKATSRKEAIKKATEGLEEKTGRFVAVREAEFQPTVRKIKQEVVDVFE
jgi:hypothetical protein